MQFSTEFNIGDYVKEEDSTRVYEVTSIDVHATFSAEIMQEVITVLYEAIDIANFRDGTEVFMEYEIVRAKSAQIDAYLDESPENIEKMDDMGIQSVDDLHLKGSPLDEIIANIIKVDLNESRSLLGYNEEETDMDESKYELLASDVEETEDNLLDDYIVLQSLIKMLGDEDGEYAKKLAEVKEKLAKYSTENK